MLAHGCDSQEVIYFAGSKLATSGTINSTACLASPSTWNSTWGMALELTTDLEPITQEHGSQLGDQLLSGIAGLAKGATEIALKAGAMAGGMDLLMGPGGIEGSRGMEAGALGQLDAIELGQIEGPITAKADRHWPGGEHGLCRCQTLRLRPSLLACCFSPGSD
jgi:hypothetical protein